MHLPKFIASPSCFTIQDEVAGDTQSDVDFGNRYSDMGNNSIINKSAMSSFPADMSRLQTADSDGRLNTGKLIMMTAS